MNNGVSVYSVASTCFFSFALLSGVRAHSIFFANHFLVQYTIRSHVYALCLSTCSCCCCCWRRGRYLSIYFLDCIATNRSSQFYAISSHIQHSCCILQTFIMVTFTPIQKPKIKFQRRYWLNQCQHRHTHTYIHTYGGLHLIEWKKGKKQMRKHTLHKRATYELFKIEKKREKNYRFNTILTNLMHCGDEQNECKRNRTPRRKECTSYAEVRFATYTHMEDIVGRERECESVIAWWVS